ncbi:hypothetical protein Tco_0008034 [Tanacetum coccineum]
MKKSAELSDTSYKSGIDDAECDPENDILLLEAILNSEPLSPLPNHADYFPGNRKELKICEAKTNETSIDEPSEVELKDLPPHLEYAFLEMTQRCISEHSALKNLLCKERFQGDLLDNPHENELDPKEINEKFPLETLSSIAALDSIPMVC